jgi:DNA repair exonuclease SbcCD ATPase subunit
MNHRIISIEVENFKRLRAARIEPAAGMNRIVGKNGAGKSSVLDAIFAALCGSKASPDMPIRDGEQSAVVSLVIEAPDGDKFRVTRKWAGDKTTLDVTTMEGAKYPAGQTMLDGLIGKLSFDPLQFAMQNPAEQAATLAKIAGVDLADISKRRMLLFNERTLVNRQAKDAHAQLSAMPIVNAPDAEVKIADILAELRQGQEHNGKIEAAKKAAADAERDYLDAVKRMTAIAEQLDAARHAATVANAKAEAAVDVVAAMTAVDLGPIQTRAENAEAVNASVRARKARTDKQAEVSKYMAKADELTARIEAMDKSRDDAVAAANLPITGLTITEDGVLFNGIPFSQSSQAERIRVSVAIGLALNPQLKLMLIREASLLDDKSMAILGEMAEAADAQVFVERVGGDGEQGIRIVDGEVAEAA